MLRRMNIITFFTIFIFSNMLWSSAVFADSTGTISTILDLTKVSMPGGMSIDAFGRFVFADSEQATINNLNNNGTISHWL